MSSSSSSSIPSDDDDADFLQRKHIAFYNLRNLTSQEYILRNTLESTTAGLVFSPITMLYFTLTGIFDARYPSSYPSNTLQQQKPHSSSTTGSMTKYLSIGLRSGFQSTIRSIGWFAGTAGLTAGLTELLKIGPRYDDNFITNPLYMVSTFMGGSITGIAVTRPYIQHLSRNRLFIFFTLTGFMGMTLPPFIARNGPLFRNKLMNFVHNDDGKI